MRRNSVSKGSDLGLTPRVTRDMESLGFDGERVQFIRDAHVEDEGIFAASLDSSEAMSVSEPRLAELAGFGGNCLMSEISGLQEETPAEPKLGQVSNRNDMSAVFKVNSTTTSAPSYKSRYISKSFRDSMPAD